jgi:hypothetical protein
MHRCLSRHRFRDRVKLRKAQMTCYKTRCALCSCSITLREHRFVITATLISSFPDAQNRLGNTSKFLNHARLWGCGASEYPGDDQRLSFGKALRCLDPLSQAYIDQSHTFNNKSLLMVTIDVQVHETVLASTTAQYTSSRNIRCLIKSWSPLPVQHNIARLAWKPLLAYTAS